MIKKKMADKNSCVCNQLYSIAIDIACLLIGGCILFKLCDIEERFTETVEAVFKVQQYLDEAEAEGAKSD